jgi:hypothetical protein
MASSLPLHSCTNPMSFKNFTQNYKIAPCASARSAIGGEVIAGILLCYLK